MKVFDGPGMVADKADAPIIPVRIDGAQFTPFSRLRGSVRLRRFPRITLTVLPPRRFAIEGEMTARARRALPGRRLYDAMSLERTRGVWGESVSDRVERGGRRVLTNKQHNSIEHQSTSRTSTN